MANLRWCRAAAAGFLSLAAWGGDFDQLIQVLKKAWPDKTTIAVVAEVASSKAKVDALAAACGGGMKIAVIDVKGPQDVGKAVGALANQKPHVLVLIPGDRVAGDGQAGATFLIQRLASQHIPTIATTEAGVKQGAVFAVGPGTGGKLLVNPKSATVAGVAVPEGGTPVS
jgi:ABC-type uncharacterized transport system substrate-binding protein